MKALSQGLKPQSFAGGNVRTKVRTYLRGKYAGLLVVSWCVLWGCVRAWGATYYVTVAGLGGEPDYEQRFTANAMDLDKIFKSEAGAHVVTLTGKQSTKVRLAEAMAEVARDAKPEDELVLTLIGHGSFDGVEYKFNLVGPDVSASELAAMCDKVRAQRQLIVDTTSASGGAVQALERPGRAVIVATKSGTEKNATVFARYWVEALEDPTTDTDKSESISAMEAFAYADRKTAEFYTSQKRLATEHPEFEDTGKGDAVRLTGTESVAEAGGAGREGALMATFTVVRLGAAQAAMNDPAKRGLMARKEELEQRIDALKYQKAAMEPGEYKKELTAALVELAKVQEQLDK